MSNSPLSDINPISKSERKNSDKYNQFNLWFFLSVMTSLGLAGLFNLVIDPYGLYKTPNLWGINQVKPEKNDNDRLVKAIDIIRIKPQIIFLGSSRTKQGLNPNHPALSNAQTSYNLALDGANPYELLRYLEHTIKNQPNLEKIILGIDFFMFNELLGNQPGFSEDRLEKTYITVPDLMNSLFSLDTLEISRESMMASLNDPNYDSSYGENGFRPNRIFKDGKTVGRFEHSINVYFHFHHQYEFSNKYFSDFEKIVKLAQEKGIKLIIFISPSHATEGETIRATGQWETWENWKRRMVQIIPVWDFSGYNSVTTEPIKAVMENYADNSHYTSKVGNLVLDRILSYQENQVPSDFGVLMTPKNIEAHLEKIRQDRATWSQKHKNEVELVETLERNFVQQQKSNPQ